MSAVQYRQGQSDDGLPVVSLKFESDIFVQLLKLNPRQKKHVIPCCFHPDTDPSLAIDLSRALWYCHGACTAPRGGGPVSFLIRWERIKNGITLTPVEARRRLSCSFKIPNAREAALQARLAEIQRFADLVVREGADILRSLDRSLAALTAAVDARLPTDQEWDALAVLHDERQFWDELWTACHQSQDPLSLERHFTHACKAGLWWDGLYLTLQHQDNQQIDRECSREYLRLQKITQEIKHDALQWAANEANHFYGSLSCPKRTAIPKTPVLKKTPVH